MEHGGALGAAWSRLDAAVDDVAERAPFGLSDAELTDSLSAVQTVLSRLTAVQAQLVHEAAGRGLPKRDGATGVVAWLVDLLRVSPAEARRLQVLGGVLASRPALAEQALAGGMNPGQALAIGDSLSGLGDVAAAAGADGADWAGTEWDGALVDKAEAMLAGWAWQFEPTILRRLGARILDHLAPDLAGEALRRRLEAEERAAHRARAFTLSAVGGGRTRVSGVLDSESAAVVRAALDPLSAPRPAVSPESAAGPDLRTPAARRADALVEVCRRSLGGGVDPGAAPVTLAVTLDYDALTDSLTRQFGAGTLDDGTQLSPATVRRLACDANVLPVVLDGAGVPIDLGRTRRLYSGAARSAVVLRDRGCAFPGCDRPPAWCQVHHIVSWLDGGPTDRDNGVLLCGHHHRLIHHSEWQVRIGPDRHPQFIPPARLDPSRRPRRNPYHPRR